VLAVGAVMAEEVRAGLARWADLLERGVHAKITDADLRAASVDPDGTGIKRLLAQLPTVREDYDVAPVRLVRDVSLEHCCMPLFP
jgi:hypothetical protein